MSHVIGETTRGHELLFVYIIFVLLIMIFLGTHGACTYSCGLNVSGHASGSGKAPVGL